MQSNETSDLQNTHLMRALVELHCFFIDLLEAALRRLVDRRRHVLLLYYYPSLRKRGSELGP